VVGNAHDLTAHKWLAFRALTVGWTLYYLLAFPVTWAGGIAENWVSQQLIVCEPTSFSCQFWRNQLSVEILIYAAAAVSGAIVARLHHRYRHVVAVYRVSAPLRVRNDRLDGQPHHSSCTHFTRRTDPRKLDRPRATVDRLRRRNVGRSIRH